jgi:hypothetical protein
MSLWRVRTRSSEWFWLEMLVRLWESRWIGGSLLYQIYPIGQILLCWRLTRVFDMRDGGKHDFRLKSYDVNIGTNKLRRRVTL